MRHMIDAFVKGMKEVRSLPIISMLRTKFTLAKGAAARVFKEWLLCAKAWKEYYRCIYSQTHHRV